METTSNTTFTPGPWESKPFGARGGDGQRGFQVLAANPSFSVRAIAETWDYSAEDDANARLMAAAPDLLTVVQAAVYTGRMRPFANEDNAFWEAWLPRAEAAIAKAIGEVES